MIRRLTALAALTLTVGTLVGCSSSAAETDNSAPVADDRTAFYDEYRAVGQGWELSSEETIDEVLDATCDTWKAAADLEALEPGTIESLGLGHDNVQSFVFAISADLMAGDSAPGSPERLAAVELTLKIMTQCVVEHPELAP